MNFQTKKSESYFLSQPHQPFFILAITNAIIIPKPLKIGL